MPRRFSSDEVIRALQRIGFRRQRQRGSHIHLIGIWRREERHVVVVARQSPIPLGTLASIRRQAGISNDELEALAGGRAISE